MVVGSNPVDVTSDIAPVSSKEFLDIQAAIECRFSLKNVRDMIRTYSSSFEIAYLFDYLIELRFQYDNKMFR